MDRPHIIERPWGRYRQYARNEPCTVWIVEMNPGQTGSLQSHENFDELWIMLTDGGQVQVADEVRQVWPEMRFIYPAEQNIVSVITVMKYSA